MYNRAIQEASRLGIEELYKLYKEIGNYKLTEEEKKITSRKYNILHKRTKKYDQSKYTTNVIFYKY